MNKDLLNALIKEACGNDSHATQQADHYDNGMIGLPVIVRCNAAGVHSGTLESHRGRECVLTQSRRLWFWVPTKGSWLGAVAETGINHSESKIGPVTSRIHLTEACEIIECSNDAAESIATAPAHNE